MKEKTSFALIGEEGALGGERLHGVVFAVLLGVPLWVKLGSAVVDLSEFDITFIDKDVSTNEGVVDGVISNGFVDAF